MSRVVSKTITLPFKLFPWQQDIIKGIFRYPHDIHIAKSKRQVGKSVTCEVLLLYYAINQIGSTSICISPTLNQSRKIFKEMVRAIQDLPVYKSSNGGVIQFLVSLCSMRRHLYQIVLFLNVCLSSMFGELQYYLPPLRS